MKTEWRFTYEAKDFFFPKELRYVGETGELQLDPEMPPRKLRFEIRIDPDNPYKRPGIEQTGTLYLTLPLPYEKAKPHATALAHVIAERISFESGHFKLLGGMISCKRIPETPEEEREIGDRPFAVEVRVIEVPETPQFDSKAFTEKSNLNMDMGLVSQHNSARMAKNPIDKFLGFFKIIEAKFASKRHESIRQCLTQNADLYEIYKSIFNFEAEDRAQESFQTFVAQIVHARHQCAHLKPANDFGYVPIDPRIKQEVEPLLIPLEMLTHKIIINSSQRTTPGST